MNRRRQWIGWKTLAVFAVIAAMILLLLPHLADTSSSSAACFVLIPVLLFGVVAIPRSLWPPAFAEHALLPQAPSLPTLFQRPPPNFA